MLHRSSALSLDGRPSTSGVRLHQHNITSCRRREHAAASAPSLGWTGGSARGTGLSLWRLAHASSASNSFVASSGVEAPALDAERLYCSQLYEPPHIVGPVRAGWIRGKGLGLVASRDLVVGDLLLCVKPLALVYGPQGDPPSLEDLAAEIQGQQLAPQQLRWLQVLAEERGGTTQGSPASSTASRFKAALVREVNELLQGVWQPTPQAEPPQPDNCGPASSEEHHEVPGKQDNTQASHAIGTSQNLSILRLHSPASNGNRAGETLEAAPLMAGVPGANGKAASSRAKLINRQRQPSVPPELVDAALRCNSLVEQREDPGASELLELWPPQSLAALVPEFALLNSSCAPNTVHILVGGTLLLRASRPIPAGAELTTGSYLGPDLVAPVAVRRSALKAQYGFHCRCPRCRLEHRLFPTRRYPNDPEQLPPTQSASASQQERATQTEEEEVLPVEGEEEDELLIAGKGSRSTRVMQWLLDRVAGKGRFMVGTARDPRLLAVTHQLLVTELEEEAQAAMVTSAVVPGATSSTDDGDDMSAGSRGMAFSLPRARALARCEAAAGQVEAEIQRLGLQGRAALLLQASVMGVYRLQAELGDLLARPGEEQAVQRLLYALRTCTKVLDAVARGSDAHLHFAAWYWYKCRLLRGPQSSEASEAAVMVAKGHTARYGPLSPGLLRDLVGVRQKAALATALGQRVGVLAVDSSRARDTDSSIGGASPPRLLS